jgi:signal transduction histidine kinase
MDIRIAITRAGIFLFVYAFVLGIPFLLALKYNLWFFSLILMAILASGGPFIFLLLRRKAEDILMAEQRRYQQLLTQASEGMVLERNLGRLVKLVAYIIKRIVKVKFAAVFLKDNIDNVYKLAVIRDSKTHILPDKFWDEDPFIQYIQKSEEPFLFSELTKSIREKFGQDSEIDLIVPSTIQNNLIGFLVLGTKLNNTIYTTDDINIFKTLSNQAALAITNCIFTERLQNDQELLFNQEKVALLGGMAGGVAHQFRNRLNHFQAIYGQMQLVIEEYKENNPEIIKKDANIKKLLDEMNEMSEEIHTNVGRSTEIIRGILSLSKMQENGVSFVEFNLSEFIGEFTIMLKVKHKLGDAEIFPLKYEANSKDDLIYGDKIRLFETLYNCIDNAYEAIEEKMAYYLSPEEKENFKPEIWMKVTQKEKTTLIEIIDNGIGIKEENKKRIFAPFFTTKVSSKKSGSGVGAFFTKVNIEKYHNGKMWFESEYKRGSTFFLEIPRKKV